MHINLFKKALSSLKKGGGGIIITVTESYDPALTGTKLWWEKPDDGDDGFVLGFPEHLEMLKKQLQKLCWDVWEEKKPKLKLFSLEKDKQVELFIHPVLPAPTLVILGAGHVATELATIALQMGEFQVVVADDRPEFANASRFPGARVLCCDFAEVFEQITFHANTYVAIITRGHKHDGYCLEKALQTPAYYIGMIGSPRKVKLIVDRLREKGYTAEEDWKRVYAPIGLPIGAQTPAEIAICIMAEIIAVKHGVRHQVGGVKK